jgi:hypothetical protein
VNQSDRTLSYHHQQQIRDFHSHSMALILDSLRATMMGLGGGEYDPNQAAEQPELRCPICGRVRCPLDVRRGM